MDSKDSMADLSAISSDGEESIDEIPAVEETSSTGMLEESDEGSDDDMSVNEEGELNSDSLEEEIPKVAGISINPAMDSDSDDTDDSDSEDEYQKFDDAVKTNLIEEYHKELKQINYDEITALTKIIRDVNGNIIDPIHKTLPFLTKFERARILGVRAKQINNGAEPFIDVPENVIEGHIIAEMELERKAIPFIIARPLPNGKKEYWNASDLELIDY